MCVPVMRVMFRVDLLQICCSFRFMFNNNLDQETIRTEPIDQNLPKPGSLTRYRRPHLEPSGRRAASAGKPPSSGTPGFGSGCLRCTAPTLWPPFRRRTDREAPRQRHRGTGSGTRCLPTCWARRGWLDLQQVGAFI